MSNWDDFQGENEPALRAEIALLCSIHSRKMNDAAIAHWVRRLSSLCTAGLWKALEEARDDRAHFQLAWVIERASALNRRDVPPPQIKPLTPVEQDASDRAAVKSLLWLHYAKGWTLEEIGQDTLGRLFARQRNIAPDDVPALIASAMEAYPKETILRWMDDNAAL